jgi:cysteine-rich repeat protein
MGLRTRIAAVACLGATFAACTLTTDLSGLADGAGSMSAGAGGNQEPPDGGGTGGDPATCGDGVLGPGEPCDDDDTVPGDGCSARCEIEDPDSCPGTEIALTTEGLVINADTTGAADDGNGSCAAGASGDLIYVISPAVDGTLRATVKAVFDPALRLVEACTSVLELACNADGTSTSIIVPVAAGQSYSLFVDGVSGGEGAFLLTLELFQCGDGVIDPTEECDNGIGLPGDACTGCVVDCSGSGDFKDPTTHHCYRYVNNSLTWFAAQAACFVFGGDLAAITSPEEQAFIALNVGNEGWIGATDAVFEGAYEWSTGEPFDFTLWEPGQPDNSGGSEDCAIMHGDGLWSDKPCLQNRKYLCERAPAGMIGGPGP